MGDAGGAETVVIVDDDDAVRDSLAALLHSVGLQTQSFANGAEFLSEWEPTGPACMLLDVRMPGINGITLQQRLRDMDAPISAILMSAHGDIHTAVEGMRAGAVDFLQKPFRDQDVLDLVQVQLERSRKEWPEAMRRRAVRRRFELLTAREREVARRILRGQVNKVIAAELGISIKTVEAHRTSLMRKLNVRNAAELLADLLPVLGESPQPKDG
jgi:two-component system response regulator FixJ